MSIFFRDILVSNVLTCRKINSIKDIHWNESSLLVCNYHLTERGLTDKISFDLMKMLNLGEESEIEVKSWQDFCFEVSILFV